MSTTANYNFKKEKHGHPVRDDDIGDNLDLIDAAIASRPSAATFVVAASDSLHKERADYVCPGVDDQIVIQAALNAMTKGGRLYLEAGNYSIAGTINMPDISGITIEGAGIGHIGKGTLLTLAAGSDCSMFKLDHSTHVYFTKFVNFGMHGNKNQQSQTSHGFDIVKNISDFFFEDLIVNFFHDDCMHIQPVDNCWNIWINQCLFEFSLGKGIFIEEANQIYINDCYFYNNFTGIWLHHTDKVYLSSLRLASHYEHGIVISDAEGVFLCSCAIDGDYSGTNSYDIIHIKNNSAVILIQGNVITAANKARAGVYIEDGCYRILITGNDISSYGSSEAVIDESTADTVHIRDNLKYITKNTGTSTGTGAQQTIAHGLSKTPTKVILWNIEDGANAYQSAAADATNIKITAVINQDYGWEAEVV